MTTTYTSSTTLIGRAPMHVLAGAAATAGHHAHVPAAQVSAAASWRGGCGFAGRMGSGFGAAAGASTVLTNSTKRIHPGRLEGMT